MPARRILKRLKDLLSAARFRFVHPCAGREDGAAQHL
jgi:hypothetical protein